VIPWDNMDRSPQFPKCSFRRSARKRLFSLILSLYLAVGLSAGAETIKPVVGLSLDAVLAAVEKRYSPTGFSGRFEQTSTIKAMDLTDTASGRIMVKRPGKMRWVYEKPDRQTIITDGITLWVHKPDDNQVMIGSYPAFFGDGKGASFLSDVSLVKQRFAIELLNRLEEDGDYVLKMLPDKATYDVTSVFLTVSSKTFDILEIRTYNYDEDETRIVLRDVEFKEALEESLFHFDIPDGIDILKLDE